MRRTHRTWSALICFATVLASALSTLAQAPVPGNTTSAMGVNFWFFWSNQYTWPFTDFFKTASPWTSSAPMDWQDDHRDLHLDSLGYPQSLAADQNAKIGFFTDRSNTYPVGDWTLLYDGAGEIVFNFGDWKVKSQSPGRIVVTVPTGNQGCDIRITRTTVGNHIRNIRFIAPGFENTYQTQFFHPAFIAQLKPFRCLRFMDWENTNSSANDTWAKRTKPGAIQGSDRGVCLEYLIKLCNTLNADIYLCMPHKADDDFMLHFVTMVRDSLKPNLKAYFEYSNEVWNGSLGSQGDWINTMSAQMGMTDNNGYWALRMNKMFTTIESVYAGQMNRAVRVVGTQVGNTGVVDFLLSQYENSKHADAIAVAPYFNAGGADGSVDAIINAVSASATKTAQMIQGDLGYCKKYNLRLIAYESGLDIWGTQQALQIPARFDPRMKAIYKSYWDSWKAGGGTLIMQYAFCDPYWGLLQSTGASTAAAPPYQAALEWIAANPMWWDDKRPAVGTGRDMNRTPMHGPESAPRLTRTGLTGTTVADGVRVMTIHGRSMSTLGRGVPASGLPGGLYLVKPVRGANAVRPVVAR